MQSKTYRLTCGAYAQSYSFDDGSINVELAQSGEELLSCRAHSPLPSEHRIDMSAFHILRHLLSGVLDSRFVNQINAAVAPAAKPL